MTGVFLMTTPLSLRQSFEIDQERRNIGAIVSLSNPGPRQADVENQLFPICEGEVNEYPT